jgi:hypothetical protein
LSAQVERAARATYIPVLMPAYIPLPTGTPAPDVVLSTVPPHPGHAAIGCGIKWKPGREP